MLIYTPKSTNAVQAARDIISVATFFHSTFKNENWLWRGQASKEHNLEPGMHTRVLNYMKTSHYNGQIQDPNQLVADGTTRLLKVAREIGLDRRGDIHLPDMALLANLQHFGAATPLLDVTTDPLIALWMVAFARADEPDSGDGESGRLYGIIKPPEKRWIRALDARNFSGETHPSISKSLENNEVWWYDAPDVTERLRIQRGSFIVGRFLQRESNIGSTIPLMLNNDLGDWLVKRIGKKGKRSNTAHRRTDGFAIVVRGSVKEPLRDLLIARSGLSVATVYPIPWSRPLIEQFSKAYDRSRSLTLDISAPLVVKSSVRLSGGRNSTSTKLAANLKSTKRAGAPIRTKMASSSIRTR